ncbi:MAG: hypothetical protein AAGC79_08965 [Pseudomonadota bacterium]
MTYGRLETTRHQKTRLQNQIEFFFNLIQREAIFISAFNIAV